MDTRRDAWRVGFTLLEVLVATAILAVIAAIVYATLSTVIGSIETTRVQSEELRLRQFLVRSMSANFATIYIDADRQDETFALLGTDENGAQGPADSIRFCSTAALQGGTAMPGDLKEVIYEVVESSKNDDVVDTRMEDTEESFLDEEPSRMLRSIETPLLGANVQEIDSSKGTFVPDSAYESPSWTVPIRSMNIRYFDGEEWVDDWDSVAVGRLPWCVEIRLNFARTQAQLEREKEEDFSLTEDPDMILVMPIPMGLGSIEGELTPGEQETERQLNETMQGPARGTGNEGEAADRGSNRGGRSGRTSSWSRPNG